MRIMVTGSRHWFGAQARQVMAAELVRYVDGTRHTLVHGGARGADLMAASMAEALGWEREQWDAPWDSMGRRAGMYRNSRMVRSGHRSGAGLSRRRQEQWHRPRHRRGPPLGLAAWIHLVPVAVDVTDARMAP